MPVFAFHRLTILSSLCGQRWGLRLYDSIRFGAVQPDTRWVDTWMPCCRRTVWLVRHLHLQWRAPSVRQAGRLAVRQCSGGTSTPRLHEDHRLLKTMSCWANGWKDRGEQGQVLVKNYLEKYLCRKITHLRVYLNLQTYWRKCTWLTLKYTSSTNPGKVVKKLKDWNKQINNRFIYVTLNDWWIECACVRIHACCKQWKRGSSSVTSAADLGSQ